MQKKSLVLVPVALSVLLSSSVMVSAGAKSTKPAAAAKVKTVNSAKCGKVVKTASKNPTAPTVSPNYVSVKRHNFSVTELPPKAKSAAAPAKSRAKCTKVSSKAKHTKVSKIGSKSHKK